MNKQTAKKEAVKWAQALVSGGGFRVLDFETTDIGAGAEIVQVAVINQDGETVLDTLVKPQGRISSGAQGVHGISAEDVKDAPPFPEVYVQMTAALAGEIVVAYNVKFEQNILKGVCKRHSLPAIKPREWTCAMQTYAKFWGAPGRRGTFRWQKLTEACYQQKITVENAHNALGDVLMTLKLIEKMAGG